MISLLVGVMLVGGWPEAGLPLGTNPRIAWAGCTWVEREQESSHFETALHRLRPGSRITVRNLGWSGDTVFGEARAGFGSVEDGYKALITQVRDVKPTVILLSYGFNESFEGPKGLPAFKAQYNRLLRDLKPLGAAIFLTGVPPAIDHPPELVAAGPLNANGQLYTQAIQEVAKDQGVGFIGVDALRPAQADLSSNGIHLRPGGYKALAGSWLSALGYADQAKPFKATIDAANRQADGAVIDEFTANASGGWDFTLRAGLLPLAAQPSGVIAIGQLREGDWELREGDKVVGKGTAAEWGKGCAVTLPGDVERAEKLRKEVARKNREFFYRWRPQNETYLFGFRKHEQGQNAREIPQFDPIIEEAEKRMAALSQPEAHKLTLVPAR